MFTGLVQGVGEIREREERGGDLRLAVDASKLGNIELDEGESIAVNGVCLTATAVRGAVFSADVSNETRTKTTLDRLRPGSKVNLERSLALGQALGGHLVSGHVDAIGEVSEIGDDGRSWRISSVCHASAITRCNCSLRRGDGASDKSPAISSYFMMSVRRSTSVG